MIAVKSFMFSLILDIFTVEFSLLKGCQQVKEN